ncbi:MAG: type-F conjugative transfer system secretin TraK [Syntrophorhabdus sp.]
MSLILMRNKTCLLIVLLALVSLPAHAIDILGKNDVASPQLIISGEPFSYDNIPNSSEIVPGTITSVIPEISTKILLSNSDVNRIVCSSGSVKDVIFSKEKGISVTISGNSAFVKFFIAQNQSDNSKLYATLPVEMFVVCSDNVVYSLVAQPVKIPAQTVQLIDNKDNIRENIEMFVSIPLETKIAKLIRFVYSDDIPSSFSVKNIDNRITVFKDVDIYFKKEVIVPGEGLKLKEFIVSLKNPLPENELKFTETDFLAPELTKSPLAIALEPKPLTGNNLVRLFVVERSVEQL